MKNKNIYSAVAIIIIICLGILFFNKIKSNDVSHTFKTGKVIQEKQKIKIGIMLPMSGDFAGIGEGIRNAALMAIDDYKQIHPNAKIDTVIDDDKFDVKTGVGIYNKMMSLDHIDTLFMVSTPILDAIHEQMTADGLPIISIGLQNYGIAVDNIFQTSGEPKALIADMARFMTEKKYKKVAVIYNSKVTADVGFYNIFKENYSGIHVDYALDSEADAKNIALKVKSESPDAILIMNMPTAGARVTKELKILTTNTKSLSDKPNSNIDFYYDAQLSTGLTEYKKILGDMKIIDGAYTVYLKSGSDEAVRDFNSKYKAKYGSDPLPFTDYGYDSMATLLASYDSNKANWIKNIQKTNSRGPSGEMRFDANGVRIQALEMLRVRGGEIVKE